jgi:hypothetical protein
MHAKSKRRRSVAVVFIIDARTECREIWFDEINAKTLLWLTSAAM